MEERLTALEELLTHQQRLVQELNEVLIRQGQEIDRLKLDIARLLISYDTMSARIEPAPRLEDEKPPHY